MSKITYELDDLLHIDVRRKIIEAIELKEMSKLMSKYRQEGYKMVVDTTIIRSNSGHEEVITTYALTKGEEDE